MCMRSQQSLRLFISDECPGSIAGQHMQQQLQEEPAREGALLDGRPRARWGSILKVLRQMRLLKLRHLSASAALPQVLSLN